MSMLLTISILFMSLPLLSYLTKSVTYTSNYEEINIQQFFQFLRDDVIKATGYKVSTNAITLDLQDGKKASIELYKELIRRRVDYEGHEIYLRDVKEVVFTPLPYGIHVIVTSLQGADYEKTIIFYE